MTRGDERALCGMAIGRHNYLLIGAKLAANAKCPCMRSCKKLLCGHRLAPLHEQRIDMKPSAHSDAAARAYGMIIPAPASLDDGVDEQSLTGLRMRLHLLSLRAATEFLRLRVRSICDIVRGLGGIGHGPYLLGSPPNPVKRSAPWNLAEPTRAERCRGGSRSDLGTIGEDEAQQEGCAAAVTRSRPNQWHPFACGECLPAQRNRGETAPVCAAT